MIDVISKPWKENEKYIIYSDGRVFSKNCHRFLKGKIDNVHYLIYNLRVNGKPVYRYAHRLVAETFIPNPNNLPVVNHKDENRLNNNIDNLEWVSHKENYRQYLENHKETRIRRPIEKYVEDLPNEEWFEIKNYSRYLASSMGRIRNKKTNRIIKYDMSTAYPRMTLIDDNDEKHHQSAHVIIYTACSGDYDLDGYVIDHIDADKTNCKFDNLQKITQSQNTKRQRRNQK